MCKAKKCSIKCLPRQPIKKIWKKLFKCFEIPPTSVNTRKDEL